jgi:hypothetical protein
MAAHVRPVCQVSFDKQKQPPYTATPESNVLSKLWKIRPLFVLWINFPDRCRLTESAKETN